MNVVAPPHVTISKGQGQVTIRTITAGPDLGVILDASATDFGVDATAEECLRLLANFGVVIYRNIHGSEADLESFRKLIGATNATNGRTDWPRVGPLATDCRYAAQGDNGVDVTLWHADGLTGTTSLPPPTMLTVRDRAYESLCIEFADVCAAYEALPNSEKDEFEQLRVVHSVAAVQYWMNLEPGVGEQIKWECGPAREHPLVWRYPDGRRSLLAGATAGQIVGMGAEEGWALLDCILNWATGTPFVLRHEWREDDIIVWSNLRSLHRFVR